MTDQPTLVLGARDVRSVLSGAERSVIDVVEKAYLQHGRGASVLPHSLFLRFPEDRANRIIALPGYLGGDRPVAGLKWIASFPGNVRKGMERASATIILNSMESGRPLALLEGSRVSAVRTAASAALAARTLLPGCPSGVSVVGCGPIATEILGYLHAVWPSLDHLTLFDLDRLRAQRLAMECREKLQASVNVAPSLERAMSASELICFATTAATPHVESLDACSDQALILHVSLRDLAPTAILGADNVVDDVDHVCREATSVHLAEGQVGHRSFIRGTLAQVLDGEIPPRDTNAKRCVFSPFGLGVLDLAVAQWVCERVGSQTEGVERPDFLPSFKAAA